jgi:hypothetical protein
MMPSLRRTLEQAFADLRGLMDKAGEMVRLAERFRQALAERAVAGYATLGFAVTAPTALLAFPARQGMQSSDPLQLRQSLCLHS